MESLPYEVRIQIIQCFGTCFHYKDNMETFLVTCGVDRKLAHMHRDFPKFVWAKHLFNELDKLENGYEIKRRILTELCKLRNLPDKDSPNPDAGLAALRKLKTLAIDNEISFLGEKKKVINRKTIAEEHAKLIKERSDKLIELRKIFYENSYKNNRQSAGYSLEDILEGLFPIFEIEYRKSYKTTTQQIDGYFRFEGFDYLVEAKWQKEQPTEGEIGNFKRKVDTKFESTRGVFFLINGFRSEVITSFEGVGSNILFFTGEDLIHILEGRIDLKEVLRIKIEKAAQEGRVFISVTDILK